MEDLAELLHRPRIVFKQHFPQFGEQQGIVHGGGSSKKPPDGKTDSTGGESGESELSA
jgi:hypothetical protein